MNFSFSIYYFSQISQIFAEKICANLRYLRDKKMHAIIFLICCSLSVFSQNKINYTQLKKENKLPKEIFQHQSKKNKIFYPAVSKKSYRSLFI